MSKTYSVEIEEVSGGLWVVARSSLPNLYVTAPSREEMLGVLPAVVEHLFSDTMGKNVKAEMIRNAQPSLWQRIQMKVHSRIQIYGKPDHRELATLVLS